MATNNLGKDIDKLVSKATIDYDEIEKRKQETPAQSAARLKNDLKAQREAMNRKNRR